MTLAILPRTSATPSSLPRTATESAGPHGVLVIDTDDALADPYETLELVGAPAKMFSFRIEGVKPDMYKLRHYQLSVGHQPSREVILDPQVKNLEWLALSEASFDFWDNEQDAMYDAPQTG